MTDPRKKKAAFRKIDTISVDIRRRDRADGAIILHSNHPLEPHPYRLTERLKHWASVKPEGIFIACRNKEGAWRTLTYGEAFTSVIRIAQGLLDRRISPAHPIAILSENSIEHALMALGALHVGIPYSPVAPAYSLRSTDFDKLKHAIHLLTPGLIFVSDVSQYENALSAIAGETEIISILKSDGNFAATSFEDLLQTPPTRKVEAAFSAIQPDTIAKILFTSGSTGLPKGVINTHANISTNWQQITQTFPFIREGLEFVDWLPWNHTYGGNHNFGFALYNGGSLYIDGGNPGPEGIAVTISNLKERTPGIYFNVPRGFENLIPHFQRDARLRKQFFSKLKMLFYAGASITQQVWNTWEQLAEETIGEKIVIATGLGSTETCPSALFASDPGGFAGLVGVPVPGLELKLVPKDGKLEARYRGKNVFPGYWRQPELTSGAFDDEGFYCSGDALRFVDETNVNKGMVFDGRITEDFKLNTGTWVSVGTLRAQMIAAGQGLIQDVVLAGHDSDFVGAIVFADLDYCRRISDLGNTVSLSIVVNHPIIKQKLLQVLNSLAAKSTGSSTLVKRALFADFALQVGRGEITDKGSINQRVVIQNYPETVARLYAPGAGDRVIQVTGADSGS